MTITQNIAQIREKMDRAAVTAGFDPKSIQLCAATKMNDAFAVRQAIAGGVDCCGENRVQELTAKLQENAYSGKPVHFIGHLQTNKVRQVVGRVDLIQSVDSLRLLQAIAQCALEKGICQDVLLQVNIAREESKSGFTVEQLPAILENLGQFDSLRVKGLMAIPPICQNSTDNHKFFQEIYNLSVDITAKKYDNVWVDVLSMGMSGDFEDAIACGANMIRIGTAIFGQRNYSRSL